MVAHITVIWSGDKWIKHHHGVNLVCLAAIFIQSIVVGFGYLTTPSNFKLSLQNFPVKLHSVRNSKPDRHNISSNVEVN